MEPLEKIDWAAYVNLPEDERWEVVGGLPYAMTPAPSPRHQMVCTELSRLLGNHLAGKRCMVIASPIDVKLSEYDIVQPDLIVVCERDQIKNTHIEGPPSLVVEVLSPSTQRHDRVRKLQLYAASGVPEYWLLQPDPPIVEVLVLDRGKYYLEATLTDEDILTSPTLEGLHIELGPLFN